MPGIFGGERGVAEREVTLDHGLEVGGQREMNWTRQVLDMKALLFVFYFYINLYFHPIYQSQSALVN